MEENKIEKMKIEKQYQHWLEKVGVQELYQELLQMEQNQKEDAFYKELHFGTGGLRGKLGAGTNRMNSYVIERATKGVAATLPSNSRVVIGYDSRIHSRLFAQVAAVTLVKAGHQVLFWKCLTPVSLVSFGVRYYKAKAGIMITASHNPAFYNGYKVYGADGCQITQEMAAKISRQIEKVTYFEDTDIEKYDAKEELESFRRENKKGTITFVEEIVQDAFIQEVGACSHLFGDSTNKQISIVYTPLHGTGLVSVCQVLEKNGYENVRVVEKQKEPNGKFPTCPKPNPEEQEAMLLGLEEAKNRNADILLATDPDCDRVGIAVRDEQGAYQLLSGNETGMLVLDYICSQKKKHHKMPKHPELFQTIVTSPIGIQIGQKYGVETKQVLTGFKYIGEQIGLLEKENRLQDFVFGFEESYGYLPGTYVRDKDGVGACFIICEMCGFYEARGMSLWQRLKELYEIYGYTYNCLHTYLWEGKDGMQKMEHILQMLRENPPFPVEDYSTGLHGLPCADVLKFWVDEKTTLTVRPSGTEPKLKVYSSVVAKDATMAMEAEAELRGQIESYFILVGEDSHFCKW